MRSQCDGVKEDRSSFFPRSHMLRGKVCTQAAQEVHTTCSPLPVLGSFGRAGCHNSGWSLPQTSLARSCERDRTEPAAAQGTESPMAADARLDAGGQAVASARAPGSRASLCKLGGALIVTLRLSKAGLGLVWRWSRLHLCSHLPSQCSRCVAQPVLSRKDRPCVCCSGHRREAAPSLQGEMPK